MNFECVEVCWDLFVRCQSIVNCSSLVCWRQYKWISRAVAAERGRRWWMSRTWKWRFGYRVDLIRDSKTCQSQKRSQEIWDVVVLWQVDGLKSSLFKFIHAIESVKANETARTTFNDSSILVLLAWKRVTIIKLQTDRLGAPGDWAPLWEQPAFHAANCVPPHTFHVTRRERHLIDVRKPWRRLKNSRLSRLPTKCA